MDKISIDLVPIIHGLLILLIANTIRLAVKYKNESPSAATIVALKELQLEHARLQELTKEMQAEHRKMQEINSQLLIKISEMVVWKDGHENMDKLFYKGLEKNLDKMDSKITRLEDKD